MDLRHQNKIDVIARAGYAARAVVYGLIGFFAIRVSLGMSGGLTDSRGILVRLLNRPFGETLLAILGVGLLCFAIWRVFQALMDSEHHGRDGKGIFLRVGYFFSGLVHVTLGFSAINLVFRFMRVSGGPGGEKELAQTLATYGPGNIAVAIAGLIIAGVGVAQILNALKETFAKALAIPGNKDWLRKVSRIGIAARGLVFIATGWLFVRAAFNSNSAEAGGLRAVWIFVSELPFGPLLIIAMATGLIAFSVYGFTKAVYRKPART